MEDTTLAAFLLVFAVIIVFFIIYRIGYFKKVLELQYPTSEIKIVVQYFDKGTTTEYYPGLDYQELFNHMSEEHGLNLLQSEMDEIIHISGRFLDKNPIQNITRKF